MSAGQKKAVKKSSPSAAPRDRVQFPRPKGEPGRKGERGFSLFLASRLPNKLAYDVSRQKIGLMMHKWLDVTIPWTKNKENNKNNVKAFIAECEKLLPWLRFYANNWYTTCTAMVLLQSTVKKHKARMRIDVEASLKKALHNDPYNQAEDPGGEDNGEDSNEEEEEEEETFKDNAKNENNTEDTIQVRSSARIAHQGEEESSKPQVLKSMVTKTIKRKAISQASSSSAQYTLPTLSLPYRPSIISRSTPAPTISSHFSSRFTEIPAIVEADSPDNNFARQEDSQSTEDDEKVRSGARRGKGKKTSKAQQVAKPPKSTAAKGKQSATHKSQSNGAMGKTSLGAADGAKGKRGAKQTAENNDEIEISVCVLVTASFKPAIRQSTAAATRLSKEKAQVTLATSAKTAKRKGGKDIK